MHALDTASLKSASVTLEPQKFGLLLLLELQFSFDLLDIKFCFIKSALMYRSKEGHLGAIVRVDRKCELYQ